MLLMPLRSAAMVVELRPLLDLSPAAVPATALRSPARLTPYPRVDVATRCLYASEDVLNSGALLMGVVRGMGAPLDACASFPDRSIPHQQNFSRQVLFCLAPLCRRAPHPAPLHAHSATRALASRMAFCPAVIAFRTGSVCPGARAPAGVRATVATDCSVVGTPAALTLGLSNHLLAIILITSSHAGRVSPRLLRAPHTHANPPRSHTFPCGDGGRVGSDEYRAARVTRIAGWWEDAREPRESDRSNSLAAPTHSL